MSMPRNELHANPLQTFRHQIFSALRVSLVSILGTMVASSQAPVKTGEPHGISAQSESTGKLEQIQLGQTETHPTDLSISAHKIQDNNYLEALANFHAVVPRWLPTSGHHRHIEIKSIDVNGIESKASVDHWQLGKQARDEEQASGWHRVIVWGATQNWATNEGIPPLRLISLADLTPRPGAAERKIRIFADAQVAMKRRNVDGRTLSCSGVHAGAEICFDSETGLPSSASVDDEHVVYEEWAQFKGACYPSKVALYRGKRLQMEATTTVTDLDDSSRHLFEALPGVTPTANQYGALRKDRFRLLQRPDLAFNSYGEVLVKVSVNKAGNVMHAELLDADDKALGKAAVKAALGLVYLPYEEDGVQKPFETYFWTSHWSTPDPLTNPVTSRASQGID